MRYTGDDTEVRKASGSLCSLAEWPSVSKAVLLFKPMLLLSTDPIVPLLVMCLLAFLVCSLREEGD